MGASISTWMQIGIVGTTAFLFIKYVTRSKRKKLPNGPPRLPYFGNALSFSGNMYIHKTLTDWSKEYGDFYSVRLGHYDAVVLSSAESMRDLLGKHGEVTSGRLNFMLITKLFKNDKGILNSEGSTWKSLRRTALSSLRDFGLGKKSLEQHIQEEAKCIMAELDKAGNNPINMRSLFMNASTNTISSLILGCRYNYDDPAFTEFMNSFDELFKHGGLQNIMMFFPEALFLTPIIAPAFLRAIKSLRVIERFVDKHIKEHRASFDSDNIRDFIDIYIQKEQESTDGSIHTEQNLFGTVFDLFGAGTDTTATSLIWAILYLIRDEDVQQRCREEINKVIGNSRIPEYNDLKQMPYVNATLQEVQRTASIAPVTILHSTSEELEYKGFVLPKNTLIIPNIYAAHRDPNYWDNPDEFNPERWLDGHGNLKTSSSYLPFGTGPRECMGKSLANQEVFIIFTSLLQQFQFSPADPSNLPSVEGQLGITMYPQEFLVKVQRI